MKNTHAGGTWVPLIEAIDRLFRPTVFSGPGEDGREAHADLWNITKA